jgi:hypothetical protein
VDVARIWSAGELEALTPNERAATIRAGFAIVGQLIDDHTVVLFGIEVDVNGPA